MSPQENTEFTRPTDHHARLDISSWDPSPVVYPLATLVLPLALLWRPLFAGEAFFWGTPLLQFVPWQRLAAALWRSGHLPLWNPLVGCGAPLAANYQTAAFYPLNILHLLLRAEVALGWTVALHLALTGWGMYRWERAVGLNQFPAFVGALALQGSGFLVGRAALFPSVALTFPWIPIWLWRAEVLVQSGRTPSRPDGVGLRNALWLGLALGLGLLAGHAQTAFYGSLLVAAYSVFRVLQRILGREDDPTVVRRPWDGRQQTLNSASGTLPRFLIALGVGVGLASVQLLPTAELLLHSQRSTGVSESWGLTYSLWPWRLITFVAPNLFGNPGAGDYWGYGAYWEDALYMGLLPLLLSMGVILEVCIGRCREGGEGSLARRTPPALSVRALRPSILFWAITAIATLILALGKNTPIFPFLFRYVPSFDLFQAPTRWLSVTMIALSALAGVGAQRWPFGHHARRTGAMGLTLGGALLIGGLAAPRIVASIPATFGPATARLGVGLSLAGALSLLRRRSGPARGRGPRWWQAAVTVFILLDLLVFGWPLVPSINRSLYHGETETAIVLGQERDQVRVYWPSDLDHRDQTYDAQYRVKFDYLTFDDFGPGDAAYWHGMREDQLPNVGMLDGVPSANNFDPLLIGEYADLMEAVVEAPHMVTAMGVTHVASDRSWIQGERIHTGRSASIYRLPRAPGRTWVVPQARQVQADDPLAAMQVPSFDPTHTVLIEADPSETMEAPSPEDPRPSLALQDGPNRVTIRATLDAPGYLVLADVWYPGWRATVDGKPATLIRANHAFRAVHLTAGEHTVEMTYRPKSVFIGGGISLMTGVILLLGMLVSNRERR